MITQGEWKVQHTEIEPKRIIVHACWKENEENYHRHICRTFGYCDSIAEEESNANLIASAPALYQALLEIYNAYNNDQFTMPNILGINAKKALAKAEGK